MDSHQWPNATLFLQAASMRLGADVVHSGCMWAIIIAAPAGTTRSASKEGFTVATDLLH